jgi:hypothetical protein
LAVRSAAATRETHRPLITATPLAVVRLCRRRLLGLGLAAAGAGVLAARGAAGTTAAPGASSDGRLIT